MLPFFMLGFYGGIRFARPARQAGPTMRRSTYKLSLGTLAGTLVVLVLGGCAEYRLPRIDPSGEHLFICDSPPKVPPPPAVTCPPGTAVASAPAVIPAPPPTGLQPIPMQPMPAAPPPAVPVAAVPVSPYSDAAVTLAPCSRVAPDRRGGDLGGRRPRRRQLSAHQSPLELVARAGQRRPVHRHRQERISRTSLWAISAARGSFPTRSAIGTTTRVAERVGQGDSITSPAARAGSPFARRWKALAM